MKVIDSAMAGAGPKRFPVYVGVFKALRDKGYLPDKIDYEGEGRDPRGIGTSAGGLCQGLYHAGIPISKMEKVVYDTKPSDFANFTAWGVIKTIGSNLLGWKKPYMNDGKALERYLEELTGGKKLKECPGLFIVTTDICHDETLILNSFTTPEMTVAKAIRASVSIPFIFDAIRYTNKHSGRECLLMDGGIRYNFPIDYFICQDRTPIVGFCPDKDFSTLSKDHSMLELVSMIITNFVSATERKSIEDAHLASWIKFPGGDNSNGRNMAFDADRKSKKKWLDIGYEITYSNIDRAVSKSIEKIGETPDDQVRLLSSHMDSRGYLLN